MLLLLLYDSSEEMSVIEGRAKKRKSEIRNHEEGRGDGTKTEQGSKSNIHKKQEEQFPRVRSYHNERMLMLIRRTSVNIPHPFRKKEKEEREKINTKEKC